MTGRRLLRAPVLLLLAILTACARERPEAACPQGVIPADAANVTRFREGPGRDITDILAEGAIADILVQCKYDKQSVTVDLQIAIAASRGPADRSRIAEFEYWVAIVDPQQNVVERASSRVRFEFRDNRTRLGQIVSDLEPWIPLADLNQGPEYRILVGFQLTPDELAWNRSQRAKQP